MKLKKYLEENGIVHGFFAKKIGVSAPQLSVWKSGQSRPKLEHMLKIEEITKGKVSVRDWIEEKDL